MAVELGVAVKDSVALNAGLGVIEFVAVFVTVSDAVKTTVLVNVYVTAGDKVGVLVCVWVGVFV